MGEFSVKRLSDLFLEEGVLEEEFGFNKIWKLNVWMMAVGRIPTKDFLIKRGVQSLKLKKECPWCEKESESLEHLFFKCKFAEGFWK